MESNLGVRSCQLLGCSLGLRHFCMFKLGLVCALFVLHENLALLFPQ